MNEVIKQLKAERMALMHFMDAYESATTENGRCAALIGISGCMDNIAELRAAFVNAVDAKANG
ncbi:MAG: hypothetical protein RL758_18 [Pseudomonadota bacterium]